MPEELIVHEYDYSNIIAIKDGIDYLVQYMDSCYKQYLDLVEEDKKRNQNLAYEYRNFDYGNSFDSFTVTVWSKGFDSVTCKNFEQYTSLSKENKVKNVKELTINLKMNYERGQGKDKITCKHSFIVSFKPYDITFKRQSNYGDELMDKIETMIKGILDKFNAVDSIFYTK